MELERLDNELELELDTFLLVTERVGFDINLLAGFNILDGRSDWLEMGQPLADTLLLVKDLLMAIGDGGEDMN